MNKQEQIQVIRASWKQRIYFENVMKLTGATEEFVLKIYEEEDDNLERELYEAEQEYLKG